MGDDLAMFVTSEQYLSRVESLIGESKALSIAVAFWGEGAEALFKGRGAKDARIICNLESGATNPNVIDVLRKRKGFQIRTHKRLHAKVFLGDRWAIVGSANASSNGLNLEGEELSGWEEAGVEVKDVPAVASIRGWFDTLWKGAKIVDGADLDRARVRWNARRGNRDFQRSSPDETDQFTWMIENWNCLKDRNIWMAVYREPNTSAEAKQTAKKWTKKYGSSYDPARLGHYENWDHLPDDADLLDIYYGPRSGVSSNGIWRKIEEVPKSSGGKIQMAVKVRDFQELRQVFGHRHYLNKDLEAFVQEVVRPNIERIWEMADEYGGDDGGRQIPVYEVLRDLNRG